MTELVDWPSPDGSVAIEYKCEAEAGVNLSSGEPWWGTRITWRRQGERRWSRVLAVDVHPMDGELVPQALFAYLDRRERGADGGKG